ncbi:response regulator transcription factor [Cohnella lupini]|uniref:Two-component system response regulator YesN n=1 Tax=Cohnella lupini TaxID=1294267 RepID=A0A3D9I239_9BACL|nr:response regulator [Cohnella lupini]RED55711.1 two-component system response regulator YesN [Cohnella lupini]
MHSILIVEDEAIELETIEHYVPWEKLGITVAGTARNGKEALGKLAELKPDIILTDVRMPIMDGLEFGRRAKQIDKNVKIIYLSGHNEFQYIKAALNIEAAGYLLKPIDMEELFALMEKVKKKCEEEQLAGQGEDWVREKLLVRIIREPDPEKRGEWVGKWEQSLSDIGASREFAVACVTFDAPAAYPASAAQDSGLAFADRTEWFRSIAKETLANFVIAEVEQNAQYVWYPRKNGSGAAVAESSFWERLLERAEGSFDTVITIGLSDSHVGFDRIWEACRQARACNDEKFYRLGGAVITPADLKPTKQTDEDREQTAVKLVSAIQSGDAEEVNRQIGSLFATFREERINRNYALRAVIRLLSAIEQHFSALLAGSLKERLLVDDWREISAMSSCAHILAYVEYFCEELRTAAGERDVDRNQNVTDRIGRIIAERYHLPLTVEEIAKEVYLSPNYIRTIFKEKTGETILDHLTKIRINRAADLLKDKSLKVREVAHAVGYENVSYFCSIFQKHRGSTPNEFRKIFL